MARTTEGSPAKQEPPIQFRPGPELKQLVLTFAGQHDLSPIDACKCLIALAACEMDIRHYPLVGQMAAAMGGPACFVASCLHVHNALLGAERLQGDRLAEPDRSLFILQTVVDYLTGLGLRADTSSVWFPLPQEAAAPTPQPEPTGEKAKTRARRKVRTLRETTTDTEARPAAEEQSRTSPGHPPASTPAQQAEDGQETTGFEPFPDQTEKVRARVRR